MGTQWNSGECRGIQDGERELIYVKLEGWTFRTADTHCLHANGRTDHTSRHPHNPNGYGNGDRYALVF
jgi:hypothetical protein